MHDLAIPTIIAIAIAIAFNTYCAVTLSVPACQSIGCRLAMPEDLRLEGALMLPANEAGAIIFPPMPALYASREASPT